MNDGVNPLLYSLSYTTIDHVAEVVVNLGVGALLAKVDIESAYRLIPVRPEDRPLQTMGGEIRCMSIQCCLLAYAQPQRFLMR